MSTAESTTAPPRVASLRFGVTLHPLDTLVFRDGRPLEAGFLHRSVLPNPQTFTGAMRAALFRASGCDLRKLDVWPINKNLTSEDAFRQAVTDTFKDHAWVMDVRFRGPWLMRRYPQAWNRADELMLPIPAAIQKVADGKRWVTLRPRGDDPSLLWHTGGEPSKPVNGFITADAMQRYLEGMRNYELFEDYANDPANQGWFCTREELAYDLSTVGIRRDLDRSSTEEGMIFSPGELAFPCGLDRDGRLCPSTLFYGELEMADEAKLGELESLLATIRSLPFGGRGNEVALKRYEGEGGDNDCGHKTVEWPEANLQNHRCLIVATSPVMSDSLEQPESLWSLVGPHGNVSIVASCINSVSAVSGWDAMRKCPQPTRFVADAGSCFFVELERGELPMGSSLSSAPNDGHGWGSFVVGSWQLLNLV